MFFISLYYAVGSAILHQRQYAMIDASYQTTSF